MKDAAPKPLSPSPDSASTADPLPAAPAPFLKTLKAPRPAAPPASTAPIVTAAVSTTAGALPSPASEDPDALPDAPLSDESFESATTVIPKAVLAHRDVEREGATTPISAVKPPPPLEQMVARIPAETRDALEQLFRARFRTVRRITPEQLR